MDKMLNTILTLFKSDGRAYSVIERDIGLPRSTIYDWENNRTKSYEKSEYQAKISKYYRVDLHAQGQDKIIAAPTERGGKIESGNAILCSLSDDKLSTALALLKALAGEEGNE